MAKKIKAYIKLQVEGGKANPAPPIGPALGQQGVNIMEFCKAFNAQTGTPMHSGKTLPVVITVYEDRSFAFIIKSEPAAQQLKKAAGITKGSATPHTVKVGKVTKKQLREIAENKFKDMNAASIETAMHSLAGTARSMGLETEAL